MVAIRESPPRRRAGIPLADAAAVRGAARRTLVLRAGLALAVAAFAVGCLLAARDLRSQPSSYFAGGRSGVVVVDFSTSIDPSRYRRIARVLRTIVRTSQPTGLIAFSDSGYEVVPPGTRGDVLGPLLRFFDRPQRRGRGFAGGFADSPWTGTFRGGTRISAGLRVARQVIEREGISSPSVLLVSDLDDSAFDTGALSREVIQYRERGIDLRIVPLFPPPQDREMFTRLVGPEAFVQNTELLRNTAMEERRTLVGSFPWALVLLAAGVLLAVALNERTLGALRWRKEAPV